MSTLWSQVQSEIRRQMATQAPRIMLAGAASGGLRKLRDVTEAVAGDELFAQIKGLPKISTDDELLVVVVGGKKVIVGPVQRTTPTDVTYDLPVIGEKGFNSPAMAQYSRDSADTASNASISNFVTTLTANMVLPAGTWSIRAITSQMVSHSSAAGVVRVRTRIGGTAGTELGAACPIDPTRSMLTSQALQTGLSGTVAIDGQYRPSASGTAYSGGGLLFALAFRTS